MASAPPVPLPAANEAGDVYYSPVIPLDAFPPGSYAVEVSVSEHGSPTRVAGAVAPFSVVP